MTYKAEHFVPESLSVLQDIINEVNNGKLSLEDATTQIIAESESLEYKMQFHDILKNANIGDRVLATFSDIGQVVGTIESLSLENGIKLVDCDPEGCSSCYDCQTLVLDQDNTYSVTMIDLLVELKHLPIGAQ